LTRNGKRGGGVVACHHDQAHPGGPTFGNGGRHFGARWVGKPHQTEKFEVEIMLAHRPDRMGAGCL
jgi:hypothetical protein